MMAGDDTTVRYDGRENRPRIPGHRLLRSLGEGGMGKVYLAEDEALGRRAAVKVLSRAFAGGDAGEDEARQRFLREARTMARCNHPNLVQIHSLGEVEGQVYLIMELVSGGTLAERIRQRGSLPPRESLTLLGQVIDGLAAAWVEGLIHRDIKPSNILLTTEGVAKVGDFGLARPAGNGEGRLTRTGTLVGSPHYMAPEQIEGGELDFRSDIYALGIVLYEMLVGRPPFAGQSEAAILIGQLRAPLPPVSAVVPGVSRAVEQLVGWMTAKEPASRPPSYQALRCEVDRLLGSGFQHTRRWWRGRPGWLAGALAALLLAAAAGGVAWHRGWLPWPGTPPAEETREPPVEEARPAPPAAWELPPAAPATEMARALERLANGTFGLDLRPGLRLRAAREGFPLVLWLEETGDVVRLHPGGPEAGSPLAPGGELEVPPPATGAKAWAVALLTERPLDHPLILGARPQSEGRVLYPRQVVAGDTAHPAHPAHAYLVWLVEALGTEAGAWDAAVLPIGTR